MKRRNFKNINYFLLVLGILIILFGLTLQCNAEDKTYRWKIGAPVPESVPMGAGMYEFAQLVEERTNGQIKIDCFPVQQLGPWKDEFDNVIKGNQEMGFLPPSPRYPQLAITFMDYTVTDWDNAKEVFGKNGFFYKYIEKSCEQIGIKLLGIIIPGFDGYSGTKGPVVYPDDIKKLKIKTRVAYQTSKLYFEKLGPVVSVDMGEVFTALQLGTIDCQANQMAETVYTQFFDVTKYYTDINTLAAIMLIVINEKLWDNLPPELQTIIQKTADEVSTKVTRISQEKENEYYKKLEEGGVIVTRLTPEQREAWVKLAKETGGLWDKSRELFGNEAIDFLLENLGQ